MLYRHWNNFKYVNYKVLDHVEYYKILVYIMDRNRHGGENPLITAGF